MEIGVGLPNAIPDVDRDSLLEFAKRADAKGFASLGTVDRLGLGARQDDYEVSGISWDTRGAALTRQLEQIRSTWESDEVGPKPLTPGGHYYEFLGDYTSQIVESVATTPEMVHSYIQAFEQAGCDELIFFPGSKHTHQVDELAGVVGK